MDILEECGPETLDELINNIQELELEVEGLRKEQGQNIVIGSCCFGREGSYKEPANEDRDLLLFLPGVDGLNIEAVDQFDYLSGIFDIWSLKVDGNDQSTFVELTERVMDFLCVVGVNEQRQAVIVGSSFGGLLAVNVALQGAHPTWEVERSHYLFVPVFSTCFFCASIPKDPQYVKGLVLVNPATSYERSHWRIVGSLVANAPGPEAFGMAAVLALATTIPDTAMVGASYNGNENTRLSFSKHLSELEALPPQELVAWFKSSTGEWLGRMLALFDKTPQHQLKWRLTHWLDEGSKVVEERLQELTLPVLVLAGSEDHMLPSAEEAARLYDLIPTCQQVVLRGVGHAALHNPSEVNLCALLRDSVIYDDHFRDRIVSSKEAKKASKRWHKDKSGGDDLRRGEGVGDPVLDFKLDLDDRGVKMAWESTEAFPMRCTVVQMMDRFTSPVFFSVNERGELNHGLGSVPDYEEGRSILFVGNHQLLGIDMPILVRKILAEKNILVRGLAHPVVTGCGTGDLFETIKRQQESDETQVRRGNNVVLVTHSLGASGITRPLASAVLQTVRAASRRIGSVVTACAKTVANGASVAHRVIKRDQKGFDRFEGSASSPSISERVGDFMVKLGAVSVTPRNMLRLFKAGESMLLYPGGVKEALHQKGQEYQIFWPEKGEFVRMAASFNATIVPFAAVGSADR
ncbi:unnamed protein product [Ectocarpus sp. CCAP 1310/34]|nr:unnamed protein product [Ectocarpus sp. CCAP 1310/34]